MPPLDQNPIEHLEQLDFLLASFTDVIVQGRDPILHHNGCPPPIRCTKPPALPSKPRLTAKIPAKDTASRRRDLADLASHEAYLQSKETMRRIFAACPYTESRIE
jgi:hypothetical protein